MDSFEQAGGTADAVPGAPSVPHQATPNRAAAEYRWWRVNCRDVSHAHRSLAVLVNRDRVVLAGPPGTTAVLSAESAGRLSTALRTAADQARK